MIKKLISLCLCFALLLVSLPMKASAAKLNDDSFSLNPSDFQQPAGEQIERISGVLRKLLTDPKQKEALTQQMAAYKSLMSGIGSISALLGVADGMIPILRMCGFLRVPEERSETPDSLYDAVLAIRTRVNEIDARTDRLQNALISELGEREYSVNLSRYESDQRAWSDFFSRNGPAARLNELYADYRSRLNAELIRYAESWQGTGSGGVRALYSDEWSTLTASGENLTEPGAELPDAPETSDHNVGIAASVTLPGRCLRVEEVVLSADNVGEVLRKAFAEGVSRALAEKTLEVSDPAFYDRYAALSAVEKEACGEKLAGDLLESLVYEVAFEAANESVETNESVEANESVETNDAGTFAGEVRSVFETYYSTLFGRNNAASPLYAAYRRLSLTHGFEGEIREDAAAVSVYLAELSLLYGSFAACVTAMDGSLSDSVREKTAEEGRRSALLPLEYYETYLTGCDNYCYPLGMAVEYHEVQVSSSMDFTTDSAVSSARSANSARSARSASSYTYTADDWHLLDLTKSYAEYGTKEYKKQLRANEAALNRSCLSTREISLLFLYYSQYNAENGGAFDFLDYLEAHGAVVPNAEGSGSAGESHPTRLIAENPFQDSINAKVGADVTLRDAVFTGATFSYQDEEAHRQNLAHEYPEVYGKSGIVARDIPDWDVLTYDEFTADLFDASGSIVSGRDYANASLAARASALKEKDMLFVFSDCELSHEDTALSDARVQHRLTFTKNYGMLLCTAEAEGGSGRGWWIVGGSALAAALVASGAVLLRKKKKKGKGKKKKDKENP